MAKEQVQAPASTKTKQENNPTIEPQESQPFVYQPGKFFALPRAGMPGRVQALQRATGNRSVQRLLVRNVIQRQPANTTPIPPLADVDARRALALDVLKKAYGGLIKQETKVNGVASPTLLLRQYDAAMIRQNKVFVEDGKERPWDFGDAAKHPNTKNDLYGFNDPSTGTVFIDTTKKSDEQTVTIAHELLHANSSGEVLSVLGYNIDEGITETLAQKAFAKAGYSAPGGTFGDQMAFVATLSSMFGENTVLYSYFTGLAPLRSMVDVTLDKEGKFDEFASAVRNRNWKYTNAFFQAYQKAREGSEIEKKVSAVISILDQLWVSDDELTHVENIYHGSTPEEQARLRQEIQPRISGMGFSNRARLRILIGA